MSHIEPSNLASRYLGISAVVHGSLENFLLGKKANVPKVVLKSAVDLLQLAYDSFVFDGFPRSLNSIPNSSKSRCARRLVADAYCKAAKYDFTDISSVEAKTREVLDLTKKLNNVQEISTLQEKEYHTLCEFWKEIREIANSERVKTFYGYRGKYSYV